MGFWNRFRPKPEVKPAQSKPAPAIATAVPKFPYPIESCRGIYVLERLRTLRAKDAAEGVTTILLGSAEEVERVGEMPELNGANPVESLRLATSVDVDAWLKERVALDPECYEAEEGEWSQSPAPPDSIVAHLDVKRQRPYAQVFLARIPSRSSWEVPALLCIGDWNECPAPQFHSALAKRWQERFGAEVVAITSDQVEFDVARPPTTREDARAIAWEHFVYCPDVVQQGFDTLNALASSLLRGRTWSFWWD